MNTSRAKQNKNVVTESAAMPNLFADHTVVLAGYGFSVDGPYLTINDLDEGTVGYVPVLGRTFSLRRLPRRRCIGRIDLRTHERSTCPLNAELLPDGKEDMCPACIEATGFNPSFYFSNYISPQQREYNQTPHYVYLAYFAPGFSPEDALDLSPYYFGGPSPDAHTMQLPEGEGFADVCGGVCAGMVGANLVFWQDGTNFIAPIKDWESHEIEFLDDEIACEYASEPQQISLF